MDKMIRINESIKLFFINSKINYINNNNRKKKVIMIYLSYIFYYFHKKKKKKKKKIVNHRSSCFMNSNDFDFEFFFLI